MATTKNTKHVLLKCHCKYFKCLLTPFLMWGASLVSFNLFYKIFKNQQDGLATNLSVYSWFPDRYVLQKRLNDLTDPLILFTISTVF